jgi:hypothetical protein
MESKKVGRRRRRSRRRRKERKEKRKAYNLKSDRKELLPNKWQKKT